MTKDVVASTAAFNDLGLVAKVRLVRTCLTNHPVYQNVPPFIPTLQHLDEGAQELEECYNAALNRDLQQVARRNAARERLKEKYLRVARYVDLACQGDLNLLKTTGFDLKQGDLKQAKGRPRKVAVLPAPEVWLRYGSDGEIILRGKKVQNAASYHVQITEGDTAAEEAWRDAGSYGSCQGIKFNGLTPGKTYGFRMRCIGGSNVGPWSLPCTLMAH